LFLLISLTSFYAFSKETVRLAIGEWAPYTSEKNVKGKFLEHVVTEAFKLEGIDVIYKYFPWKRSYIQVQNGEFDGTFPWNKTKERKGEFYIHKLSLYKDEAVYYHLKNNAFNWNTIDDLKQYNVGVTIGYKHEKLYKEKGITVEPVASEELNFKKILVGRIDVYRTSKIVGYETINRLFSFEDAARFTHHPTVIEEDDYFILFSKNTPNGKHFALRFDSGLKQLKASGAYDKIIGVYF